MSMRERYVWICTKRRAPDHPKGSCGVAGANELLASLARALEEHPELSARVCSSSCFDLCGVGPAIAVMPENTFYERFTEASIPALLEALRHDAVTTSHPALAPLEARPESFIDAKDPKKGSRSDD